MIKGIGTDIIEINRFDKSVNNNKFMSTYYTDKEIEYIKSKSKPTESAAAFFCAKEAVAKAIGTGFSGFSPKDIGVEHDEKGKPCVVLGERAKTAAEAAGIKRISLSLSHCRDYAVAFAAAEGDE